MDFLRKNHGTHAQAKAQPESQARKRQAEATNAQEGRTGGGTAKQARNQITKSQEPQLTPKEVADRRKLSQQEGFEQ
eukprot:15144410-Heterocapsa_arctica.AAC.1